MSGTVTGGNNLPVGLFDGDTYTFGNSNFGFNAAVETVMGNFFQILFDKASTQ